MKIETKSMYQYAKEAIVEYINNNKENIEKLPSEQDMADMMGVSRSTIREALRILEREGIIYSRHGVGTFIVKSPQSLTTNINTLESSTKIITDHGYAPGTLNVYCEVQKADERISSILGINKGDKIFYVERVRTADNEPVILVLDYFVYEDDMEKVYAQTKPESILDFLKNYNISISYAVCGIKAVISDKQIEHKLMLKESKALLLLEQTHFSNKGQSIFYSDSYYISDKFNFNIIRRTE
ncbi:MAG: GntR family transcriptional regulator [Clostridiales bacterium]|nr:GntR family transcriptional regulator [Clostridiales bacterium]